MVMVSPEMNPTICWLFEAEIVLLFHAKTFHKGFQVTVHVGNVRQTATVVAVHGKVSSSAGESQDSCFQSSNWNHFIHSLFTECSDCTGMVGVTIVVTVLQL